MKNLFFIIIILGFVSCESNEILPTIDSSLSEMESQVRSTTIVDSGPETTNPDNPQQLCIGCGCQKDFNTCMGTDCNWGSHSCCDPMGSGVLSEECCKDNRSDCHNFGSGWICFRLSIFDPQVFTAAQQDSINNGKIYFTLGELTSNQIDLLSPYASTIEKWQEGTTLTHQDFSLLDRKLDEF